MFRAIEMPVVRLEADRDTLDRHGRGGDIEHLERELRDAPSVGRMNRTFPARFITVGRNKRKTR